MNGKETKKPSINTHSKQIFAFLKILYHVILILGVIVSVSLSLKVYLENRREGSINIFLPPRYGTLRGTHQSNTSDKFLLCFTIHNDGNLFRNIKSINLTLTDENGSQWELKAIVKIDNLKDLNFKKYSLKSHPNYSLVTSISLDKNQFVSPNLIFYYEYDIGWPNGEKVFRLKKGAAYTGKITVISVESDDNSYQEVQYRSDYFNFTVIDEPFENMINTFTNINIGELKLNKTEERIK